MTTEQPQPLDLLIAETRKKNDAEATVNEAKAEIKKLKPQVSESFLQSNTKSIRRDGFLTSISSKFKFTLKDGVCKEDVTRVLDELGYGDMNKREYQYMRVCSMLREMDENEEEVPQELLDLITYGSETSVTVRKS